MEVVKETKKAEKQSLKSNNLEEVIQSLHDVGFYLKEKQFEKAYHALDMAALGIAVEKISIIKKDSKNEKFN